MNEWLSPKIAASSAGYSHGNESISQQSREILIADKPSEGL